jgi:hypothetical protein
MEKIARMLALTPSPHSLLGEAEAKLQHAPPRSASGTPQLRAVLRTPPSSTPAKSSRQSLFVLQLWRAMQRTVPTQSKTLNYTEMFDLQFADHLSRQGRFGLAEQLYEQLSRYLPDTGEKR